MKRVFMVMGRSSVGKDTLVKMLLDSDLGLVPVITCTTRPIRPGEVNGREYWFVSEDKYHEDKEAGKILECRSYSSMMGNLYYYSRFLPEDNANYIIVATPTVYNNYREYYPGKMLYPMLVEVDEKTLIHRALDREESTGNCNYVEMCRRFVADAKDYSVMSNSQNFYNLSRHVNLELETCYASMYNYIKGEIQSGG